ncbi:hypothetical protein VTK26DRAFT_4305 [Humicola hyalothermophila]
MPRPVHQPSLGARADSEGGGRIPTCEPLLPSASDLGLRIASIFIIFVGSAFGALLPVFLARPSRLQAPKLCFFVARYFGTGVILATAWMHLLSPASDSLRDECLGGVLPDYDWAMAIGLMTIMVMFLLEIVVSHCDFGFGSAPSHGNGEINGFRNLQEGASSPIGTSPSQDVEAITSSESASESPPSINSTWTTVGGAGGYDGLPAIRQNDSSHRGGKVHLGHHRDRDHGDEHAEYATRTTAIFILEFGVIFHSIFIGLTLAVTSNFIILFVVLVFHQTFEGLGLGARLATATGPLGAGTRTPYLLGLLYAASTPLAIGVGLVARQSLALDGATSKIVSGVFDAVSGGILMYTGLVELVAHEFMFNPEMRNAGLGRQFSAYACVVVGVALMALLANWA